MKKRILFSVVFFSACLSGFAQLIAFPGAEGFGKYTTGGRGGEVYYVTTLDDCSDAALVEGTLRWAIRHDNGGAPRSILFKVGGTIYLTSALKFQYPNVSILGQTAPGGGICMAGARFYVNNNNVIIRYLRFRAGDLEAASYPSIDIENAQNVIIDHCSFSWSMEENVTMYDNRNTTLQWCILSEPLYYSKNIKGQRAYGAQWGGENSSYHHNLFAHCVSRIPRVNGVRTGNTSGHDLYVDSEIINNVMFNCGGGEVLYGGELEAPNVADAWCHTYLINNYFKPGPVTQLSNSNRYFAVIYTGAAATPGKWFIDGNMFENNSYLNRPAQIGTVNADNWAFTNPMTSDRAVSFKAMPAGLTVDDHRLTVPLKESGITMTTAAQAYADVTAKAGARLPRIDEIDARILAEAKGEIAPIFTGNYAPAYIGVIDSQNDITLVNEDPTLSGWTDLRPLPDEVIPEDSDLDGMPDEWELANGLNPLDASDRNGTKLSAEGYTNLEVFLNAIVSQNTSVTNITTEKIPVAYYSIMGVQLQKEPEKGFYIILYNNGKAEKRINGLR